MKIRIINALDSLSWRRNLINLKNLDACYLPEYHLAYSTRLDQSQAILWVSEHEDKKQAQENFGRRSARLMKTVGKIDDAVDAGNYKKAKRLKDRADRLTKRIQKK